MKVLFVTEKWTDVNPSKPLTNSQHNLFGSLECSGLATFDCIHYDEYFHLNQKNIDEHLIEVVERDKPDVVIVTPLPWYKHSPTPISYSAIADKTKLVFVWADAAHFMDHAINLEKYASAVVLWDVDTNWKPKTKYIHLWTPQDPRIYYDNGCEKDIDVSFIGNPDYPDRRKYLNYLINNKVPVCIQGGRNRAVPLQVSEYANLIQRSKITLNFSLTAGGLAQLKGRPFEAMMCGSMVMESRNERNWLERWFIPNVHYVPFSNEIELKNKIDHYLHHDEERKQIAINGWRRTKEYYNNVTWWEQVFRKCGFDVILD